MKTKIPEINFNNVDENKDNSLSLSETMKFAKQLKKYLKRLAKYMANHPNDIDRNAYDAFSEKAQDMLENFDLSEKSIQDLKVIYEKLVSNKKEEKLLELEDLLSDEADHYFSYSPLKIKERFSSVQKVLEIIKKLPETEGRKDIKTIFSLNGIETILHSQKRGNTKLPLNESDPFISHLKKYYAEKERIVPIPSQTESVVKILLLRYKETKNQKYKKEAIDYLETANERAKKFPYQVSYNEKDALEKNKKKLQKLLSEKANSTREEGSPEGLKDLSPEAYRYLLQFYKKKKTGEFVVSDTEINKLKNELKKIIGIPDKYLINLNQFSKSDSAIITVPRINNGEIVGEKRVIKGFVKLSTSNIVLFDYNIDTGIIRIEGEEVKASDVRKKLQEQAEKEKPFLPLTKEQKAFLKKVGLKRLPNSPHYKMGWSLPKKSLCQINKKIMPNYIESFMFVPTTACAMVAHEEVNNDGSINALHILSADPNDGGVTFVKIINEGIISDTWDGKKRMEYRIEFKK